MGDRRFGLVVLVAILIAAASAYGVSSMLRQAQAEALVPTLPVVVAARDISDGRLVEAADVNVIALPVAAVPPGSFRSADSVVGRVTRLPIFTGETFLPGRLAPVGTGAGLEVKITPGKRAMAIRIDDVAGLSGLIQPNSRVDVLVTVKDGTDAQTQRAKLFMSNMRVLSVGSQVERGPDGRPMNATTAALEVTPIESEQLAIAANQGKIQLVLRGYGDPDTVETQGATVRGMLGGTLPPPVRAAPVRSVQRAAATAAPAPAPAVVAPVPPPKKPDSAVIQVYRRNAVTQQKMLKRDSTIPPDTLSR